MNKLIIITLILVYSAFGQTIIVIDLNDVEMPNPTSKDHEMINFGCLETVWNNYPQYQSDVQIAVDSYLNSLSDIDSKKSKMYLKRATDISDGSSARVAISKPTQDKINAK